MPLLCLNLFLFAMAGLYEGHLAAMFVDPVIALVFVVCEHGGRCFLFQSCSDGESAWAGTDDDYIEEVREGG